MKVFVAGGTGAIGRLLVPGLIAAGHQVTATTRDPAKAAELRRAGAEPVILDALDRAAVEAAVGAAEPTVVIHQLTSISGLGDMKRLDEAFARTNELRTVGLDHLLAAAHSAGATRMITQSFGGWPNERTGGPVKTEEDRLDPTPTAASRHTHAAIRYAETTTVGATGIEGLALRYGTFYGPGTGISADGPLVDLVRKRRMPVVGGGTGVWSFIQIEDAAAATVAAVENGSAGVYNIVDDDPVAVTEWLPYFGQAVGAKTPMRVPSWMVRPVLGEHGIVMMTQIRGCANTKAKRELGWTPRYSSWREGFRTGLG